MFNGYEFSQRKSWVVAKGNGRPSESRPEPIHPDLFVRDKVIETTPALRKWLAEHR
jgi:hypothetical protein